MTETNVSLELGAYEVVRQRLDHQAAQLTKELGLLDEQRKSIFGSKEQQLLRTERIITDNYCIARDMTAIGNYCLFGYNVHVGMRKGIQLQDVFACFELKDSSFQPCDMKLLEDAEFEKDFQNLYRYYKDAFFSRFYKKG